MSENELASSRMAASGNTNPYKVVLCDPPWRFRVFSKRGLGKSADKHYRTLDLDKIVEIVGGVSTANNAALFLWITDPMLEAGLELIREVGFQYKTVAFTWVKESKHGKEHMGTGYYTRANPEMCLLATKGKPLERKSKSVRQLLISKVREHSRKPDEIYDRIEALFDGPYLEVFARTKRNGWDAIGNEVGKFE